MDHDASDILGGELPFRPHSSLFTLFGLSPVQLILGAAGVVLISIAWHYLYPHIRQWRERRYRKAIRRRHGIPDNDNRPFNVAFAAAKAAQRSENGSTGRLTGDSRTPSQRTSITPEEHTLRQRNGFATSAYESRLNEADLSHHIDTRFAPLSQRVSPSVSATRQGSVLLRDRSVPAYAQPPTGPVHTEASSQPGYANGDAIHSTAAPGDYVPDDGQEQEQELPETTVDGKSQPNGIHVEHVSGDEMEVDETSLPHTEQASKKRTANDDDDGINEGSWGARRDKRPRKVSRETQPELSDVIEDEDMDVEETVDDLAPRGKKRERADAGSTFGGDDSSAEEEERPRRHRKRRTVSHRTSAGSRGQKRGRDIDVESDEESGRPLSKNARKSRAKRGSDIHEDISQDPLCKDRRIGEEWESNGTHFKVGPNGQRLRQELVKKSRSKFPMPSDSQHPDRHSNIDVFVETWLTEEEYHTAKEHHELAWQDTPKASPTTISVSESIGSASNAGKSLLWSSTSSPQKETFTPVRGPFRQSIISNGGLRSNLLQSQATFGRRISSPFTPSAPSTPDSPKIRPSRSYSKWEKQDLEAAAMNKIREKAQKEEAARKAEEQKKVQIPALTPAAAAAAPTLTSTQGFTQTSTINFPSATAKPAAPAAKPPVPLFSTPSTHGPTSTKPPATEPPKLSINTGATPTTSTASDTPKFTFGVPSKPAESTTNTAASTASQPSWPQPAAQQARSAPNFFTKPVAPAPSTTAPASAPASTNSPFGGSPAASNTAPKSAFTFGSGSAFTPTPQPNAAPKSVFSAPSTDDKKAADISGPASGGSLLSRLGPLAAQQPSSTQSGSTTAPSIFGSGATGAPAASTTPAATASTAGQAAPSSQPAAPKFNFGFSKPVASAAPTATPAAAPSTTTNMTTAGNSSNAAAPSFTFGAPKPAAPPAAASAVPAAPTSTASSSNQPLKFNFGVPGPSTTTASSSNPFGSTTNAPSAGPSTTTSNPFGGNSGATAPTTGPVSVFGGPTSHAAMTSQPAAGPSGSVFGGAGAGASNAAKSPFSFGSTPSAPSASSTGSAPIFGSSSMSTGAEAPKSSFLFGGAPSAMSTAAAAPSASDATTQQSKPAFSFNFGAGSSATPSPFGAASSGTPSAFGAPASNSGTGTTSTQLTPSAFGFGNPSTTSSGSVFGSSNTTGQPQK